MHEKQAALLGSKTESAKVSRRSFVGGGAAAAAAAAIPLQPLLGGRESAAKASIVPYNSHKRMEASFGYRTAMARAERIDVGEQSDNGDADRFTDFSGNYSKGLLHDALGVPNKAAVESLIHAFQTSPTPITSTAL